MKILHLSQHYGCLKDKQYILEKLGHEVTSLNFQKLSETLEIINPIETYRVSKPLANIVWKEAKDYLNSFDVVLTSDTTPISRVILENIEEFTGKLVIWICNRYNYEISQDGEWTLLFDKANDYDNVTIVAYTEFEKVWCNANGIRIDNWQTITPLGKWSISELNGFEIYRDFSSSDTANKKDIWVSRYWNDNKFTNMRKNLEEMGLTVGGGEDGRYKDWNDLRDNYYCFHILPEQISKLIAYELIHAGVPAILPSKEFLTSLWKREGYGIALASATFDDSILNLCAWYDEEFVNCRYYYNSFKEIPFLVEAIKNSQEGIAENCAEASEKLEKKVLTQWKNIYDNL